MKTNKVITLIALSLFIAIIAQSQTITDNKPEASLTTPPDKWSAFSPLSIPFDLRKAEFEKGNIVSNFSFEKGEIHSSHWWVEVTFTYIIENNGDMDVKSKTRIYDPWKQFNPLYADPVGILIDDLK